jgi:multidrug efflux pump subunit AcrA (membrane-fusion protein)
MSQKLITSLLFSIFLLTSCGTTVPTETITEAKKPFIVDIKLAKDFTKTYTLEKSGRLVGSSTIVLASQGVGRVSSISIKEGTTVKK